MRDSIFARLGVEAKEQKALILAFLYFFGLMCGYYMLRSVREAMGVRYGPDRYNWLYTYTFIAMFVVQPIYGGLVASFARKIFVPVIYAAVTLCLLAFYLVWQNPAWRDGMAPVFYVWLSIVNLLTVAVFWSFMSDVFEATQAKRLFGYIAAGGATGGLCGAGLTMLLAKQVDIDGVFLIASMFFMLTLGCAIALGYQATTATKRARAEDLEAIVGGTSYAAFKLVVSRVPLRWLSCLMVFAGFGGGILYILQGHAVRAMFAEDAARAAYFARIDLLTNVLSLVLELFAVRYILLKLGTARVMSLAPLLLATGFLGLALIPTAFVIGLFQVLSRGIRFALAEPALASCYTTLDREVRYKGKGFIDTFIYRLSDLATQWSVRGLTTLGFTGQWLFFFGLSMALINAALGYVCGRQHEERLHAEREGKL
jgi:AAA family ATP:ADP antiporter